MTTAGLLLVGCGKMGSAMLAGWCAAPDTPRPIAIVEPMPAPGAVPDGQPDIICVATRDALPPGFRPEVVVLATKPQVMDGVVPGYAGLAGPETLFVSVRTMPNTPAQVGRGITVCCANAAVSPAQRALAGRLMGAVGEVGWVEDEGLIDAVTAVSGSGPAYAFLLAECMAEAGREAGLPADLAMRLARATVAGAGELLHRATESAGQLRRNVTSPNGTTAAALEVLMAPDGMQPLMSRAVAAAARRSRELAG
jgi:pyrroline-5-carboxylate reductase